VVLLCGGLPADVGHLAWAADQVDLLAYRSNWMHHHSITATTAPHNVRVRSFSPVVRTQRGHLAFAYRGLHRMLDRDRPDIVHVISEPWGLLAVQAAAWVRSQPGARLVLHGCDTLWHHGRPVKQRVRRMLLRRTLPVTSAWVAENSKALALAHHNGMPTASRTARIHTNPRDSTIFRPPSADERERARARLGIGPGDTAVGFIGRLVAEKGLIEFLDAAESLIRQGFAGRFLVAGTGPLAAVAAGHASAAIRPLGRLDHPDGVAALLQALDVVACPSLATPVWEDQGPRALLEAMMAGCVPVVTPTGALPEMVADHGVVAASTDREDLRRAIVDAAALASDTGCRVALSSWATRQYSAEAVGDQLVGLWRSCATDSAP
jgi:glycosyltransferase involved in cell wall biosynthesis